MNTVTNTDHQKRHWNGLTNAETGRTLELEPGASAQVELPEDFAGDVHLKVSTSKTSREAPVVPSVPSKPSTEAGTPADPAKEL